MPESEVTSRRRAVVLSGSCWTTAGFGPYGSAWLDTPSLNAFAAGALVLDRYVADSCIAASVLISQWTGQHAANHRGGVHDGRPGLPRAVVLGGSQAVMVTDDPQVAAQAKAAGFSHVQLVPQAGSDEPPAVLSETQASRLLETSLAWMGNRSARLVWVHASYLEHRWDAPVDRRGRWTDEEGPEPYLGVAPPRLERTSLADDDALLGWIQSYADQVSVLDECLGPVLEPASGDPETMWIVAGVAGMALGEHSWVGPGGGPALSPRTHLPLMIRAPGTPAVRSAQLCQPPDVGATLASWLGVSDAVDCWGRDLLPLAEPKVWIRDPSDEAVVTLCGDDRAIQVTEWNWLRTHQGREFLYLKPDDRFDANDVADRAADVCQTFRAAEPRLRGALERGDRAAMHVAAVTEDAVPSP